MKCIKSNLFYNIQILNSKYEDVDGAKYSLFEQSNDLYVAVNHLENKITLFSKKKIETPIAIKISDGKYKFCESVGDGYVDGSWNVYNIAND